MESNDSLLTTLSATTCSDTAQLPRLHSTQRSPFQSISHAESWFADLSRLFRPFVAHHGPTHHIPYQDPRLSDAKHDDQGVTILADISQLRVHLDNALAQNAVDFVQAERLAFEIVYRLAICAQSIDNDRAEDMRAVSRYFSDIHLDIGTLVDMLAANHHHRLAAVAFEAVLNLQPTPPNTHQLGRAALLYHDAHRFDKASGFYGRLLRVYRKCAMHTELATVVPVMVDCLILCGRVDEAVRVMQENLVAVEKDNVIRASMCLNYIRLLMKLGRQMDALPFLENLVIAGKDVRECRLLLARCYLEVAPCQAARALSVLRRIPSVAAFMTSYVVPTSVLDDIELYRLLVISLARVGDETRACNLLSSSCSKQNDESCHTNAEAVLLLGATVDKVRYQLEALRWLERQEMPSTLSKGMISREPFLSVA